MFSLHYFSFFYFCVHCPLFFFSGAAEKDDSVGVATLEKKTRYKRAMKEDLVGNKKAKRKKAPSHFGSLYQTFVTHTQTFKNDHVKKKSAIP